MKLTKTWALVAILMWSKASEAQFKFLTIRREIIQQRLQAYKGNDRTREATLKTLFESVGCRGDKLVEQPVKGLKEPNLICTLPGQTDSVVVVGAHYDHAELGDGVADNWSGASLLPSFYQVLSSPQPQKTFVFVGFAGEEQGLIGSRFFVKQLSNEGITKIQLMICIDTLGLSTTEVWVARSDERMVRALNGLAHGLNLPLTGVNVGLVGMSDEEPFIGQKIPVLVVHSVTQGTLSVLHSLRDNYKVINFDDYYDSYRLLSGYLQLLNRTEILNPTPSK